MVKKYQALKQLKMFLVQFNLVDNQYQINSEASNTFYT